MHGLSILRNAVLLIDKILLSQHWPFTLGALHFVRFTDQPQETIYVRLAAVIAKFF